MVSGRDELNGVWEASFADVIDISDGIRAGRRVRRRRVMMRVAALLLLAGAVCVALFPLVLQSRTARSMGDVSDVSARTVAGWPYSRTADMLAEARAYNVRLAEEGQPVLGEAADPFADGGGGSRDSVASDDGDYQRVLDSGAGVMGTVSLPQIGVRLPIYHGASEQVLAVGAGHLYGTSLPVGGEGTHAVITGHRGLVDAMMFTRLDELDEGDFMYVEVLGSTLGYQVDRVSVIDPDDVSQLKIVPGEDRLTLMTCTPYGVNTHRLLVSGHRVDIPLPAPDPHDVRDVRAIGIRAFAASAIVGALSCLTIMRSMRAKRRIARHAAV